MLRWEEPLEMLDDRRAAATGSMRWLLGGDTDTEEWGDDSRGGLRRVAVAAGGVGSGTECGGWLWWGCGSGGCDCGWDGRLAAEDWREATLGDSSLAAAKCMIIKLLCTWGVCGGGGGYAAVVISPDGSKTVFQEGRKVEARGRALHSEGLSVQSKQKKGSASVAMHELIDVKGQQRWGGGGRRGGHLHC